MILAAAFGIAIGVALGLLGAGGSILAMPALVYGIGQPFAAAVPASLIVVGASAAGGLLPRLRTGSLVRWPVALVFGAAGMPAALIGGAIGRVLPERVLLGLFAVLMGAVAVRMLRGEPQPGGACARGSGRRCLLPTLLAGAVVGLLTGVFGVGGGFVIVPALTMTLGLTAPEAVATSLVIIVLNSLSGLVAHLGATTGLDYTVIAVFAALALAASAVAGRFAVRLPARTVRRGFAILVLTVAAGIELSVLAFPTLLPHR